MSKSYDEYTPEDWANQVKADEFDALYAQSQAGHQAAAQAATANNCTNPPHFPPHCGCPAG